MFVRFNFAHLFKPFFALFFTLFFCSVSYSQALDSKKDIEEMTITASKTPLPLRTIGSSVSVLTQEDLEAKGYLALGDVLRTLPGISVSNSGGLGKNTSVFIRGEDSFRTLLLLDGIDISDTTSPQISPRFEHLLNTQLGRVEVLRGPQGLVYGADAAGVVSAFSKESNEVIEGDLALEAGRYDTQSFSANLRGNVSGLSYSLSASDVSSNGFNTRSDDPSGDNDGYDNTSLHFKGAYKISDGIKAGLILRNVESENEFDQCFSATPNDCLSDYAQKAGRVFLAYDKTHTSGELSYSKNDTDNTDFTGPQKTITNDREGSIEKLQYFGTYRFSKAYAQTYGFDRKEESFENNTFGGDRDRYQNGLYTEALISPNNDAFISVGLRYDDNEDFGSNTNARVSGAYIIGIPNAELTLKSAVGTGFRAPSLFEENNSDGRLVEEYSTGSEIGIELSAEKVNAEVTFFYNTIEDQIIFSFDPETFDGEYLQVQGDTESKGVELQIDIELLPELLLGANYTYNRTNENPFATENEVRLRRPKDLYNVSLEYTTFGDRLTLLAAYRSSRDAIDFGGVTLDNYEVLDLNASLKATNNLLVFARITNASDEEYQEITNFNVAGSATYIGLKLSF